MTDWNKERIQELIVTNDAAVKKALLVIFNNQTADERSAEATHDRNNIGFTGVDAKIMTSFAKQLIGRGFLSSKQLAIARRKLPKYWRQLKQEIIRREETGVVVAPKPVAQPTPVPMPVEPLQGEIFGSFS